MSRVISLGVECRRPTSSKQKFTSSPSPEAEGTVDPVKKIPGIRINPVVNNNGINYLPTGDRRISEPSPTV